MYYRKLGRTGLDVSVIAFGGIMLDSVSRDSADHIVERAVSAGINLFDVSPTYGNAQNIMGPALETYRDGVFLAGKTEPNQTRDEVRSDLENSLKLLRTDYFDLYQLHEVTNESSLQQALAPGGALEAIIEARDEGLVHHIGFSAHSEWAALKLMDSFDFDTVMFPINWNYWLNQSQGKQVIARARETDKGIIAIKALAHRQWRKDEEKQNYHTWYKPLFDNKELAELALKFTLSRDVDTAVTPGDVRMLDYSLELLNNLVDPLQLSEEELKRLKKYASDHDGKLYPIPR